MRIRGIALFAALAAFAFGTFAWADEPPTSDQPKPDAPKADKPSVAVRTVVIGDGKARFNVTQDVATGKLLFRLSDPKVQISQPMVVVNTDAGPKEVRLSAVEGQSGTWFVTHEAFRQPRFDATMRVIIEERPFTAPIVISDASGRRFVVRHGGMLIPFDTCDASIEVVRDPATGTLTFYSPEDVRLLEPPVITLTEKSGPVTVKVTPIEGQPGAWRVTHEVFKTTTATARVLITVNGKPCEADLTFPPHGGRIVTVEGGPRFEVVHDPTARHYTFYALDERIGDKAVVIENPQVIVTTPEGPQAVRLAPVQGEPRA